MATVARAVDQIHHAGMLHLDIKPSNILLDGIPGGPWDQVRPMIADFGIARVGDDPGTTATGPIGVRGTPSFMAPEQIAGDRAAIGPRSDVYALGATLYSLLTGRPPFQAASVIETLDLVRTREPAPLRTLVPDLSRDLETIALTCLRKDPRQRYASACACGRPSALARWVPDPGASGLEARTHPPMVPAPAGVCVAPGHPRVHRGVEPRGLADTLAPFRSRARAGRECPGPCDRERQSDIRRGPRSR